MPQTTTVPVALLICDDHRILTDALAMVVGNDPTLALVRRPVASPEAAIKAARRYEPDVVLMDVTFRGSDMTGIEATRRIKAAVPDTNVVIMTANEDDHLLIDAVEAGACGFLQKSQAVAGLLSSVRAAAAGDPLIDDRVLKRILREMSREKKEQREASELLASLTERESETLQLLATGMRNDDVADALDISPTTVQTHVRNILRKLDAHSKLEAVTFAVKYGAVQV